MESISAERLRQTTAVYLIPQCDDSANIDGDRIENIERNLKVLDEEDGDLGTDSVGIF
jgi:hypothetical protein